MFRKVASTTARFGYGLVGVANELIELEIFRRVAMNLLPFSYFKPLGGVMAAGAIPAPLLEATRGKQAWRVLGYIPCAIANTAIFACEGPTAAVLFTVALGVQSSLMAVEVAYKKHSDELTKADVFEFVVTSGKMASILLTIQLGGAGEVFELLKNGEVVPSATAKASAAAAALAGVGGLWKIGKAVNGLFSACKKFAEDNEAEDYQRLQAIGDLELRRPSV